MGHPGEKLLTVVIPAYNEAEALPLVLPELLTYAQKRNWKVIIVNDGSKDNTKEILNKFLVDAHDLLKVIHHKLNHGYGGAIKSGIEAVDTEYTITIDADGQHYLEDIDKLGETIIANNADMVVGSRKGLHSTSNFRGIGKWLIRNVAKLLMPIDIYDINSGMKIYRTALAKQYIHLFPDSMAFSDIITLVFINNRHLVLEIPIEKKGTSCAPSCAPQLSMDKLAKLLNKSKVKLPVLNPSRRDSQVSGLPPGIINRFKAANQLDYRIYDYYLTRFHQTP